MDTPYTEIVDEDSWLEGYFCALWEEDIDDVDSVRVLDIDYSDKAGRAVAKVAHEVCASEEA